MKKIVSKAACVLALGCAVNAAASSIAGGLNEEGFYAGLGVGYMLRPTIDVVNDLLTFTTPLASYTTAGLSKKNTLSGRLFIGSDMSEHTAIEAGYAIARDLTRVTDKSTGKILSKFSRTHLVDVSLKVKASVTDSVNVYVRAGLDVNFLPNIKNKRKTLVGPCVGIGADVGLTDNWIVGSDLLHYGAADYDPVRSVYHNISALTLSLRYKF